MLPKLSIVVPCFNESDIIHDSIEKLLNTIQDLSNDNIISDESNIIVVDDGSTDESWESISDISHRRYNMIGIKLSRNVGHQNALLAGLNEALNQECDIAITIDADLQDDITKIKEMINRYKSGNDIVYGVRSDRKSDSLFKRKSASYFYKIMEHTDSPLIPNHSDFRLMSRRALTMLMEFDERNLFLRGIVPLIGLNTAIIYYERKCRTGGKSKYPLTKMISFAIEGITSFSVRPIRMIFLLGFIFLILTLIISLYVIIAIFLGRNIPGWASIMLSLWFIGSLILMALGIIGEYVSKIYLETKQRPRYFIEKTTGNRPYTKKENIE